jgi:hypothetical protein
MQCHRQFNMLLMMPKFVRVFQKWVWNIIAKIKLFEEKIDEGEENMEILLSHCKVVNEGAKH